MVINASGAGAWWLLVFVVALVLVAQVPPRRLAPARKRANDQTKTAGHS